MDLSKYVLLTARNKKIKAGNDMLQDLINAPRIFYVVLMIESRCIHNNMSFCSCIGLFVSNSKDRVSRDRAQIFLIIAF